MSEALIAAVGCCLVIAVLSAALASSRTAGGGAVLHDYLLASGKLSRIPVVSLIVSSSFGVNAVFYQIFLGYSIGLWALVAQAAWALSFIFLSRFAKDMVESKSLHDFLSRKYGPSVRIVAALLSITGFCFLMGWELEIGRSIFVNLVGAAPDIAQEEALRASDWLVIITAVGATIYTIFGGMRGNALADMAQNLVKIVGFLLIFVFLIGYFYREVGSLSSFIEALLPPFSKFILTVGIIGFLTNLVFSLSWQFVDASTWQNALAGSSRGSEGVARDIWVSGFTIFIAPGVLGTIVGACLAFAPGVDDSNILAKVVEFAGGGDLVLFLMLFAIIASMMSLFDGMLLAAGYAFVVDVLHPTKTLQEIDESDKNSYATLTRLRFAFVAIVIVSVWGVSALAEFLGLTLFDLVYLVIIPQLAILGPVLMGLIGREYCGEASRTMAYVMIGAFLVGLLATWSGPAIGQTWLVDVAGTLTVVVSVSCAWMLTKPSQA